MKATAILMRCAPTSTLCWRARSRSSDRRSWDLRFQCAKCHDHKFEPVTQRDYYQLQAILYPAFNVEHWLNPNDRVVIAGPEAEQGRWEAHDKAVDAADRIAQTNPLLRGREEPGRRRPSSR